MINDDTLVKFSLSRLKEGYIPREGINNWVDYTKFLSAQIREIRDLDFTAIGLGDLNILRNTQIRAGMRIILSDPLDSPRENDNASILGLVCRVNPENPMIVELEIEGIGHRNDFTRDPWRKLGWGQKIYPDLSYYPTILEMTSKPRSDGGPVYYYYNKSTRDARENYVPGLPEESARGILGSLRTLGDSLLSGLRERSQYMHFYRRTYRDISGVLSELPLDHEYRKPLEEIYQVFIDSPKTTKITAKTLATMIQNILTHYGY